MLRCIRPFGKFLPGDDIPEGDAAKWVRAHHQTNVVQVADPETPAAKEPSNPKAGEDKQ